MLLAFNRQKDAKKFSSNKLGKYNLHEESFRYRVAHYGYNLTYCPEHI